MQIASNSLYDIGSSYTIKLNEKEILVVEDDPVDKRRVEAKKVSAQKEQDEKKAQESKKSSSPEELSTDEERLVKDLASRDSEVRAHESAHIAASGGLAGAASFTYQQGPDGKMYAIGGEVSIATPSSSSPEEAIQNARKVAAAALAAGDPSPQDFAVASSARVMEMQATQQKNKETLEKQEGQQTYSNEAISLNTQEEGR
ncbi:MAG: putative metalloprotease CJM1_0395 family protein [Sulfurimonas sp.]|nr:putative metalloprotease CJM1_0395 family protein [Sulfurimonas sp.]